MRRLAAAALALGLAGCAGAPSPTVLPPSGPVAEAGPPPPAEECAQAGELAAGGDHKPAVDLLRALAAADGACDPQVLAAVEASRLVLEEADALVRSGLEARRAGDVATARDLFGRALALYPKYYWVQRLASELPAETGAAGAALRRRAGELRGAARHDEALVLLEEARRRAPEDPELAAEIATLRTELGDLRLAAAHRAQRAGNLVAAVELARGAVAARPGDPVGDRVVDFARRLGLELFAAGELVAAREIWAAALELDADNELLRGYVGEVEVRLRSLDDIKDDGG